jgi:hypothetical protein
VEAEGVRPGEDANGGAREDASGDADATASGTANSSRFSSSRIREDANGGGKGGY